MRDISLKKKIFLIHFRIFISSYFFQSRYNLLERLVVWYRCLLAFSWQWYELYMCSDIIRSLFFHADLSDRSVINVTGGKSSVSGQRKRNKSLNCLLIHFIIATGSFSFVCILFTSADAQTVCYFTWQIKSLDLLLNGLKISACI